MVANAGISDGGRSTTVSGSALHTVINTNFLGVYLTAREGSKRLIAAGSSETGKGRMVLIGSITADMTGQGDAAYAASKAAVSHLGHQFAREWVRKGINVNTVQPGYIRTERSAGWLNSERGRVQVAGWHRHRLMDFCSLDDMMRDCCGVAQNRPLATWTGRMQYRRSRRGQHVPAR